MTPSRIRSLRLARGLTLDQLAAAVGTSKSYIWQLEHKETNPGAALLSKIAQVLGVTTGYLLGIEDDLVEAEDRAFYRRYVAMPEGVKKQIRAVANVMKGME